MSKHSSILLLGLILLISSCSDYSFSSIQEKGKTSLSKTKYVNGIKLKVTYVPTNQLVEKATHDATLKEVQKDSLRAMYDKTVTFLFQIAPDERKTAQGDIMYKGVRKYQEYAERMAQMNFNMEPFIQLTTEKGSFQPVLTNMENVYGLNKGRTINVVFAPTDSSNLLVLRDSKELRFTYEDELFDLGINHFQFYKSLN